MDTSKDKIVFYKSSLKLVLNQLFQIYGEIKYSSNNYYSCDMPDQLQIPDINTFQEQ